MSICVCTGCQTQQYYDQVREKQCQCNDTVESKQYELVIRTPADSDGHGLELLISIGAMDASNILSEYFGLDTTLTFLLEQED